MQSLRELYKVGRGPSSSHTMGPERAVKWARTEFPSADSFKVTLYGSLALTGQGHGTDKIIKETFQPISCEIIFDKNAPCSVHPNTMDIEAFQGEKSIGKKRIYSVGGGTIAFDSDKNPLQSDLEEVYDLNSYSEISDYCLERVFFICPPRSRWRSRNSERLGSRSRQAPRLKPRSERRAGRRPTGRQAPCRRPARWGSASWGRAVPL